jgi:nucleoid-associated protein YgaU
MKQNEFLDLPKLSYYRFENFFNIYKDSDNDFNYYNLLRSINIFPAEDTDVEESYVIKYSDTWLSISYNIYNTIELWWIICAYNQIQNPTTMPEPGTVIKILKASYISAIINELNKQISR